MTSNMKRKIYIVGGDYTYANWMDGVIVNEMKDADLVCFAGGEDVSPHLYGEPTHPKTGCNPTRDGREVMKFKDALEDGKKLIGICRGAQFLCVAGGGKLVQDQQPQPYYHKMTSQRGEYVVTSTHHQAQYPWGIPPEGDEEGFEILGWTNGLSKWHEDGRGDEIVNGGMTHAGVPNPSRVEVEIAYYRKIKALCIQPHPEHMYGDPRHLTSIIYFQLLLNDLMEDRL